MNIYLLDCDREMIESWMDYFDNSNMGDNIYIVCNEFPSFMKRHDEIDAVVSPANAFGIMTGGYDLALTEYFGGELMKKVQEKIINEWHGEQPVGSSISVKIPNLKKECILIHTPTTRIPERIVDKRIPYYCMRSALIEAEKNHVKNIVIPAFGRCTGRLSSDEVAIMMFAAYSQVKNPPKELNWKYAYSI